MNLIEAKTQAQCDVCGILHPTKKKSHQSGQVGRRVEESGKAEASLNACIGQPERINPPNERTALEQQIGDQN
jgi:hypothetical protein